MSETEPQAQPTATQIVPGPVPPYPDAPTFTADPPERGRLPVAAWGVAALVVLVVAGALVFAVHPVHVEAVSNLVGRSDVICAAFTLAALLAHRRRSWLAVPCYAAALFAKESGVTFIGLASSTSSRVFSTSTQPSGCRTPMATPAAPAAFDCSI